MPGNSAVTASAHNAFLELFGEDGDMAPELPREAHAYRVVAGHPDDEFHTEVESALTDGYHLWGPPTVAVHDETLVVAQALFRPDFSSGYQA